MHIKDWRTTTQTGTRNEASYLTSSLLQHGPCSCPGVSGTYRYDWENTEMGQYFCQYGYKWTTRSPLLSVHAE